MKKSELVERIKRNFGYPIVKVELDESQIVDAIDYTRSKFIKWAVGNATQETYFTIPLSGGVNFYDMPSNVTEIISYADTSSYMGGINTLFTLNNYLYNNGLMNDILNTGDQFSLIGYHIALDFLDTVNKYDVSKYNWKYHKYSNKLEIHPAPLTGNSLSVLSVNATGGTDTITIDSPGYVLLRGYMLMESSDTDNFTLSDNNENMYDDDWFIDYATACCKITLGTIRRKFANFNSIGNMGISMDGDTLVSEGKEEKERLEETLRDEESHEGYGISMG